MQIRLDGTNGYHIICDRCGKPAKADGDEHVWVEVGDPSRPDDELGVTCADCNRKGDGERTSWGDVDLGQVLLGVLVNAHEPFARSGGFMAAGSRYFGEDGFDIFKEQVLALAEELKKA